MLFALTGDVQTGKTRWLQRLVRQLQGAGVPCAGVMAPGVWRSREDGGYEKLGIDNVLLPGGAVVPFATRRDLAQQAGGFDAASQAAQAGLGWAIDDAAIARVNGHFEALAAEAGVWEGVAGAGARPHPANEAVRPGLLVVDELGRLELLRGQGLAQAAALLDRGPTRAFPCALVVVRAALLPRARERFEPAWGGISVISPDERSADEVFQACSALAGRVASFPAKPYHRSDHHNPKRPRGAALHPGALAAERRTMIDKKAFHSLSYGLYIISSESDGRAAGCVCNTFAQVTSDPLQVSVALNKQNATTDVIRQAGRFAVACLSEDATMELIGVFGFHTSADTDKFSQVPFARDEAGIPYVTEAAVARFSAQVTAELDLGSHVLFIGKVTEAEPMGQGNPMTYAYYHAVKGGKTPPKASSYLGDEAPAAAAGAAGGKTRVAWRCTICGHIEYVDELPDDFTCPVCGMGKEVFERIEVPAE